MKLLVVIDLDKWNKSCHRLKIPRCLLLEDFEVLRTKSFTPCIPDRLMIFDWFCFWWEVGPNWDAYLFFENGLINMSGETKYWSDHQKPGFLRYCEFSKGYHIWSRLDIKKRNKMRTQFVRSIPKKNFSPIGLTVTEKKGWNLRFFRQKVILRKTQNKVKLCFFVLYFFFLADVEPL
jgi:hypothetical protein